MKFIIEHLEKELYNWCLIEYKNISKFIGKDNLIITNIKTKDIKKLKNLCRVETKSIKNLNLKNSCLLDPAAKKELTSKDKKFDDFIFGGILGDYPQQNRTSKILNLKIEKRNLTKHQMPTDTAVIVAKLVLDGNKLSGLKFKDKLQIEIKKGKYLEVVELPYRYLVLNNKPTISKQLVKYIKAKEEI